MEMDIDRLCLENAIHNFLKTGKKEDAFNVYYSYLYMFVGEYEKTRRMIELLSEFEMKGSELLMKHRDHYVHSVYVFVLELKSVISTTIAFAIMFGLYVLYDFEVFMKEIYKINNIYNENGLTFNELINNFLSSNKA